MGEDGGRERLDVVGEDVVAPSRAASAFAARKSISPARGLAPSSTRSSRRVASQIATT